MDRYNLGNGVENSCLLPVTESSQEAIRIDFNLRKYCVFLLLSKLVSLGAESIKKDAIKSFKVDKKNLKSERSSFNFRRFRYSRVDIFNAVCLILLALNIISLISHNKPFTPFFII